MGNVVAIVVAVHWFAMIWQHQDIPAASAASLARAHILDTGCAVGSKCSNDPQQKPELDKSGSVLMHVSAVLCVVRFESIAPHTCLDRHGAVQPQPATLCALIGGLFCCSVATIAW